MWKMKGNIIKLREGMENGDEGATYVGIFLGKNDFPPSLVQRLS